VYNASAGAGKTYQLVQNFLELCLREERPDLYFSILAITFTNKAAKEMKERLISALEGLAHYPPAPENQALAKSLCQTLALKPQRLAHRAEATLKHILHHYSAFSISTIDSFTNRVIRSFSRDLKVSSNYQVELDIDLLLQEALDLLFDSLTKDNKTTLILERFIDSQLNEGKSPQVQSALFKMAKSHLFNEGSLPFLQKLNGFSADEFLRIEKDLRQLQKEAKRDVSTRAEALLIFMDHHNLAAAYFTYGDLPKWLDKLKASEIKLASNRLGKQITGDSTFYSGANAKKEPGLAIQACEVELRAKAQELQATVEAAFEDYQIRSKILANFYTMAVLAEVEQNLAIVKEESSRLPISDFNKLISTHLREQPAPFIYEKIGSRYRHYFIDEFQDTSALQWQNLQPLLENTLAEEGGSALIVGDAKQAIYRWRGGEVQQFVDLCHQPETPLLPLENREVVQLEHNWRSAKTIVDFNNAFFSHSKQFLSNPQQQEIYQQGEQNPQHQREGLVKVQLLPHQNSSVEEFELSQCQASLKIIKQAIAQDYNYNNIALLVRSNRHGSLLAEFLVEQDIAVVSPDSLKLGASPLVAALISFLALLNRPDDAPARIPWLEFLYEHFATKLAPKQERHQFLAQHAKAPLSEEIAFYEHHLAPWRYTIFEQKSLTEKIYYLLECLQISFRSNPFVQRFLDLISEFEQNESPAVAPFLRHWYQTASSAAVELPEGLNAVKIMTIHKAKGLEFPVVIFAFANIALKKQQDTDVWVDLPDAPAYAGLPAALISMSASLASEIGEESLYAQWQKKYQSEVELDQLNMVYVALTRAVNELHILSSDKLSKNGISNLQDLLKDFGNNQQNEDLSWGQATQPHEKEAPLNGSLPFGDLNTHPWEEALKISEGAPKNWQLNTEESESVLGTKMHALLAQLQTAGEVETVVANAIQKGSFAPEEQAPLSQSLQAVVLHPQLAPFYTAGLEILNERSILVPGQKQRIPDRVVLENNVAHVLDYKTGKPLPQHKKQVDDYAQVLQNMGYTLGHRFLVYLGQILTVEADW
jgi:ATP-dependent exoDNAse (exonuclease V) beta subunit